VKIVDLGRSDEWG